MHHVTGTVDSPQEDLDFFLGTPGLRLVKKTVNFDNNQVYHFYYGNYGNERGSPGTIMTTFPYGGHGVRPGIRGTGQIIRTSNIEHRTSNIERRITNCEGSLD